ncbi:MAG: hypothetical protein CM1200mP26_09040 [Acidimicrobiales bacterium]|nr:MAG: hypothetical protein CM1200mP26_09040 [Acidimicrobiales bacterium]
MVPPVAPPETPPNEVHDAPLTMLRPIVDALGATLLPTDEATDDDLEVVWGGAVLAAVRRPDPHLDLHDALPTLYRRGGTRHGPAVPRR